MSRATSLATGAIGGAVVAGLVGMPWLVALAVACFAVALLAWATVDVPRQHRVAAAAVGVGAALVLMRAVLGLVANPPEAVGPATTITGTAHEAVVLSVGTPSGGLQRATLELRSPEPPERVYAWLPRYPQVVATDVIRFDGRLEPAPTTEGFGEFLARSGIAWTVRTRSVDLAGSDGSALAALEGVRRTAAELITRALPEPQAGLAAAMMIGLRDVVARDVTTDFRTAGLSHVVAISGWHICMLAAVITALLSGLRRRPRSILVLLAIVAYSIFAGASPSVMRAAVMASVVVLARDSGRAGQAPAALALTCAGMLLFDPRTIDDVGFQLSVAATAGLLVWSTRLGEWLRARVPRVTPAWLVEALAVSLAAQAATLPLILLHFASLSTVAPLANLLVAPLVAPAMLFTFAAFVAGGLIAIGFPALLLAPVTLVGAVGIGAMVEIARFSASLPFATVAIPEPLNLVAAAAAALAILVLVRRRPKPPTREVPNQRAGPVRLSPRLLTVAGGCISLCLLLVPITTARPDGRLHVTVLDIGQGDAILLQGPNGGRMLIDTGPDPDLLLSLLDARLPAWDRRIDIVVLTHPHEDHVAGLALLLERYRIGDVVESGMVGPGPSDAAYRDRLTELGRTTRAVAAGDLLLLDGITIEVEWPPPGHAPVRPPDSGKEINNESLVLDLHFGQRRMLFTGDLEEDMDARLIEAGIAENGEPLDVLKVAHHGSRTATSQALIDALDPQLALISAAVDNDYGHPAPETIERLEESGARVLRTDLDGSIELSTNGTDLVVATETSRSEPIGAAGNDRRPTYNRHDGDPLPIRSRRVAAWLEAERQADGPLRRGRRGRCVHLRCHGPPRCGHRRDAGRDRRVPA